MQTLKEIGLEMVASDNRATMAPVWFVDSEFPRFFLSEAAAERYRIENNISFGMTVASASNDPQILSVMKACIEAAEAINHPQVKNCYSVCF